MNNTCPSCGSVYGVTPQHIGREFKCRKCGAALVVKEEGLQLAGGETPPAEEQEPFDEGMGDTAGAAPRSRRSRGGSGIGDYLAFRKMIVPIIIQVIFWVLVALAVLGSLGALITAITLKTGFLSILAALASLFIGPLLIRIFCESLIVMFRINDTLTDIKNVLEKK